MCHCGGFCKIDQWQNGKSLRLRTDHRSASQIRISVFVPGSKDTMQGKCRHRGIDSWMSRQNCKANRKRAVFLKMHEFEIKFLS